MKQASLLETAGFPPEGEVFPIGSLDLRVVDGDHPWVNAHRPAIAENWSDEISRNPALYDGRMVFQQDLSFGGSRIIGRAYMAPFSAFIYWRRQERGPGAFHLFGIPVIQSSDGALVAIRMSERTANPGRVYFAAGSMDADDVVDGRCDIDFNMRREVLEETSLDLAEADAEPGYFGIHGANAVTVFRVFRFALTEAEIMRRIAAHVADDPEPEITNAVAIRNDDPAAHDYAPFMLPLLKWMFGNKE